MKKEFITKKDAINEANRCLHCSNPQCILGCPLSNNIPQFIKYIKEDNLKKAYSTLIETTIIPEICGRICPHLTTCEKNCVLGLKGESINIRELEKYVSDNVNQRLIYLNCIEDIKRKEYNIDNKKYKVAIIGTGPSSISTAFYLAVRGYDIKMFEHNNIVGGLLSTGIPRDRLSDDIVKCVFQKLNMLGIKIEYNVEFGKDITIDTLRNEGYSAIFLGIGAQQNRRMNILGENLQNVYTSKEFMYSVNRKYDMNITMDVRDIQNKKVAIIGGGNVALDCAITSAKLGASETKIIYRRTKDEMLISQEEYDIVQKNNIELEFLSLPIKFIGKDKVEKIECVKMQLGDIDETGRRSPIMVVNSNYSIDIDYVILCLGSKIDMDILNTIKDLEIDTKNNTIVVNDYGQTSIPYIFAGGDVSSKRRIVSNAAHLGMMAGKGIEKYLNENK